MKTLNRYTDEVSLDTDVWVQRPTKWGNPYLVGRDGTRVEVLQKYEDHVRNSPTLMASLHELVGKNLICSCSPLRCHADILIKLVQELDREELIER